MACYLQSSWWLNHFQPMNEKYAQVKLDHLPRVENSKKYLKPPPR